MLLSVVLLWGLTFWFGFHPQQSLGSAEPLDLIVVLDGGSSRLSAAERIRQRILHGDPQRGLRLEPDLLLIRCPPRFLTTQIIRADSKCVIGALARPGSMG